MVPFNMNEIKMFQFKMKLEIPLRIINIITHKMQGERNCLQKVIIGNLNVALYINIYAWIKLTVNDMHIPHATASRFLKIKMPTSIPETFKIVDSKPLINIVLVALAA